MNGRCCARCKTPFGCGRQSCHCHVAARLAPEIAEHRMLDTFGGYDWGDPIRLWTVRVDDRLAA